MGKRLRPQGCAYPSSFSALVTGKTGGNALRRHWHHVIALIAMVAAAVAASPASAVRSDGVKVDEHAGEIFTQENECFETADRRPVPIEFVRQYVPARYTPEVIAAPGPPAWPTPGQPVGVVGFTDYVCESFSVNGHSPRPTIVSMGVVSFIARDGIPQRGLYVLWVGTDNPLLFVRLRQLGVTTYFIPRSNYTETVMTASGGTNTTEITVNYVGNGPDSLTYTRRISATEGVLPAPPDGPASGWFHLGSKGEVAFTFFNHFQPFGRAAVCLEFEPGSIPTQFGLTGFPTPGSCFPTLRLFIRGSWEGHHYLVE